MGTINKFLKFNFGVTVKKITSLFIASVFICNANSQTSREDLSKELNKPNVKIEAVVSALAENFNKNKEKLSVADVILVGATDAKRHINLNYQITAKINKSNLDKSIPKFKEMVLTQTCDLALVYVLMKEHKVTLKYWWFDKDMKQLFVFDMDGNSCK